MPANQCYYRKNPRAIFAATELICKNPRTILACFFAQRSTLHQQVSLKPENSSFRFIKIKKFLDSLQTAWQPTSFRGFEFRFEMDLFWHFKIFGSSRVSLHENQEISRFANRKLS